MCTWHPCDQLARDRARLEEVKAIWYPSCFGGSHEQRMQWGRLGKERGDLRCRIEEAERESK